MKEDKDAVVGGRGIGGERRRDGKEGGWQGRGIRMQRLKGEEGTEGRGAVKE